MFAGWTRLKKLTFILTCFGFLFLASILCQVQLSYLDHIHTAADVPSADIALVLGASIDKNGQPSPQLLHRLQTAGELYQSGKVKKILLTGDDGQFYSNEIVAMENSLLFLGVSSEDILLDGHGYRTYESCRRAKYVYGINEAIIITQRFHLARALFLCERLGIRSTGVVAELGEPNTILKSTVRDLLASVKAYIDIYFIRPKAYVPDVANKMYQPDRTDLEEIFPLQPSTTTSP